MSTLPMHNPIDYATIDPEVLLSMPFGDKTNMHLILQAKKGVSPTQLGRNLGVNHPQKVTNRINLIARHPRYQTLPRTWQASRPMYAQAVSQEPTPSPEVAGVLETILAMTKERLCNQPDQIEALTAQYAFGDHGGTRDTSQEQLDNVRTLLKNYFGGATSLERCMEGTTIRHKPSAGRILKRMGLSAPNKHHRLTDQDQALLVRAAQTQLSWQNIAELADLNAYGVKAWVKRNNVERTPIIRPKLFGVSTSLITISEIYEAQDLRFGSRQISELLDLRHECVKDALERRDVYEPILIDGLNKIDDVTTHKKPYRA